MRTTVAWIVVLAVLIGVASAVYLWQRNGERAPPPAEPAREAPVPAVPEAPPILYPVPEPQAPVPSEQTPEPTPQAPALPALDQSDTPLQEELGRLVDPKQLAELFVLRAIIPRFVTTIDNLTAKKLPAKHLVTRPVPGHFLVLRNAAGREIIDPENYRRYSAYVAFAESVDTEALVSLYVRYYPLLQTAYEDLGYPNPYFNDRLVQVIDHLLQTPDVGAPVELVRPTVVYKFADPDLEALSAGQKALLRMGPDNAARIKVKLRALRAKLATLGK